MDDQDRENFALLKMWAKQQKNYRTMVGLGGAYAVAIRTEGNDAFIQILEMQNPNLKEHTEFKDDHSDVKEETLVYASSISVNEFPEPFKFSSPEDLDYATKLLEVFITGMDHFTKRSAMKETLAELGKEIGIDLKGFMDNAEKAIHQKNQQKNSTAPSSNRISSFLKNLFETNEDDEDDEEKPKKTGTEDLN